MKIMCTWVYVWKFVRCSSVSGAFFRGVRFSHQDLVFAMKALSPLLRGKHLIFALCVWLNETILQSILQFSRYEHTELLEKTLKVLWVSLKSQNVFFSAYLNVFGCVPLIIHDLNKIFNSKSYIETLLITNGMILCVFQKENFRIERYKL